MKFFFLLFFISSCSSISDQDKCLKEGSGDKCHDVGMKIFSTITEVKNKEQGELIKESAANWFRQGCDNGSLISCHELGRYHLQMGRRSIGKMLLEQACQQEHDKSCIELKKYD